MSRLSDQFVAEALKWIGTPWVEGGRSECGIDCLGLIVLSAKACGLEVRDHPELMSRPGMKSLVQAGLLYFDEIPVREIRKGSILLIHLRGEKDARHIAIYDGYAIVHCGMHWGKVVHHRLDDRMKRNTVRAFNLKKEFEDGWYR